MPVRSSKKKACLCNTFIVRPQKEIRCKIVSKLRGRARAKVREKAVSVRHGTVTAVQAMHHWILCMCQGIRDKQKSLSSDYHI